MGGILQLLKDFILVFTTGYIIFWFFKDCKKAILWYLLFYALISILGPYKIIYNQYFVIPLTLLFVLLMKPTSITKPNVFYVVLFIYMLLITYLNGLTITGEYSRGTYLYLILLIFSNYLFSSSDYAIKIVFFIWLITLAFSINSLIFGQDLLSVANIESGSRAISIDTGITGSPEKNVVTDLNYFSSGQAIGAMISILFLVYRKKLSSYVLSPMFFVQILKSNIFGFALFFILGLQIWLVFRGLSRGGILVLLAGVITMLYMLKNNKYLLYGGISMFALYLFMNQVGIIDLLMERVNNDETGTSGRDILLLAAINSVYSQGGNMQIIFGGGIDWPWWDYWIDNKRETAVSTHNQWMSMFVNLGLLGLVLFFIPLAKGIRNSFKNNNPINNIRIVLFVCVFIESLSLEPLVFSFYIWFIVAMAATYTPNEIPILPNSKVSKPGFIYFNY